MPHKYKPYVISYDFYDSGSTETSKDLQRILLQILIRYNLRSLGVEVTNSFQTPELSTYTKQDLELAKHGKKGFWPDFIRELQKYRIKVEFLVPEASQTASNKLRGLRSYKSALPDLRDRINYDLLARTLKKRALRKRPEAILCTYNTAAIIASDLRIPHEKQLYTQGGKGYNKRSSFISTATTSGFLHRSKELKSRVRELRSARKRKRTQIQIAKGFKHWSKRKRL